MRVRVRVRVRMRVRVRVRVRVADAPHILPRDVADPIEPGVVQRLCTVGVPPG